MSKPLQTCVEILAYLEVCRDDVPYPMALFACESWAQQWITTLSQHPLNYKIRPVDVEPRQP